MLITAVTLLNKLDHTLEKSKYLRYMDDLIFIGSITACKNVLAIIEFEAKRLNINLSKNKTYIQPVAKPIKFLGFTFLLHDTKKVTLKRIKSKLNNEKRKLRRMKNNKIPIERIKEHYQSVRSCMKKAIGQA